MLPKKQKKRKRGIEINKKKVVIFLWSCFCVLFVGYLLFCNVRILQKRGSLSKSLQELGQSIETLTKEKETLSYSLGETYSPEYIEKVAREDLGMQKAGEEVVVIKKEAGGTNGANNNQGNIWQNIVNWFDKIKSKF